MKTVAERMKGFWRKEEGIGTLEIILIIAVIIIIAFIFKNWIISLVNSLLGKADSKAEKIFD
ncbi:Flp1 family type IVb pilin [Paenibacillus paeoniae]|uniref:Multidrug transporter n=1 Tax=Paenibacillus paeoniae TaxID=2292705 RepID=A0A371PHF8_9BACL|nr:Flp1 family type IVb pilin [Paenibacillus paeoniae]REK75670.1 multidrug transporter [Paenibacillus paeoniae]